MDIDLHNITPAIWGPVIGLALFGLIALVFLLALGFAIWDNPKDAEKGGE